MDEKKMGVILEALASQIEALETKIYILKHGTSSFVRITRG